MNDYELEQAIREDFMEDNDYEPDYDSQIKDDEFDNQN